MLKLRFCVGDVVTVARASGVNNANARAVVVEVYELERRAGWMLLFEDGRADGFSPDDCLIFDVQHVSHEPSLAGYVFRSMTHLARDFRQGVFSVVWNGEHGARLRIRS